jgi:hypothetical protein
MIAVFLAITGRKHEMNLHTNLIFAVGVALLASTLPSSAQEVTSIGKISNAKGLVTIEHVNAVVVQARLTSGVAQAKVGDPVFRGDVVQTGDDGQLDITFEDGTAFNLASNARMVLDDFVYDAKGKSNSSLFSLTRGTFTFLAGATAKTGEMKVVTPVATMGIRGTAPRVEMADDGTVTFSTLIEERKGSVVQAPREQVSPLKLRQTKDVSPPIDSSVTQREEERDKRLKSKLNICRGC